MASRSAATDEKKTAAPAPATAAGGAGAAVVEHSPVLGAMLSKQFLNKTTADLEIAFIDEGKTSDERFPAHKFVLSLISSPLAKLIAERKDAKDPVIIPDVKSDVFRQLLQWVYTGRCDAKTEDCPALIVAAVTYELPIFAEYVGARLASGMDVTNACDIFNKAPSASALKYIAANLGRIVTEPSFLNLTKDRLTQLLISDELDLAEGQIFKAVCAWGEAEAKRQSIYGASSVDVLRGMLSEHIPLIRFPLMALADLTGDPLCRDILEGDKLTQLCTYVSISDEKVRASLPCGGFSKKPRKFDSKKKAAAVVKFLGLDKLVGGFFGLR